MSDVFKRKVDSLVFKDGIAFKRCRMKKNQRFRLRYGKVVWKKDFSFWSRENSLSHVRRVDLGMKIKFNNKCRFKRQ